MTGHDHPLPDLSGQVAWVTGGGRGLGRAYAEALAAAGATVAVTARTADQLDETVERITSRGGRARAVRGDVTDEDAVAQAAHHVTASLGPVELLVNNAGVGFPIGPLWEVDPDDWWRCVTVNLRGPFLCARAVLPTMVARKRGRIVNVSSGAGIKAIPYLSGYVTSKAALIRLTEVLAGETRGLGITVFAIEPGTVLTAMAAQVLRSAEGQRWMPWFRDIFEQGRDVSPECSAQLVVLLASGMADQLTGRFISGGDDLSALVRQANEIEAADLHTLRLRR